MVVAVVIVDIIVVTVVSCIGSGVTSVAVVGIVPVMGSGELFNRLGGLKDRPRGGLGNCSLHEPPMARSYEGSLCPNLLAASAQTFQQPQYNCLTI